MTNERLAFGLFLLMAFVVWIGRVVFFAEVEQAISFSAMRWAVGEMIRWLVWMGLAFFYIKLSGKNRLLTGLLSWPNLDQWGKILLDTTLFVLFSVLVIKGLLRQPLLFVSRDLSLGVFFSLISTAIVEEYFFRGLVLRQLVEWMTFPLANVTVATLFVFWHLPGWMYFQGPQSYQVIQGVALFFLGLLLGQFVKKTGSIWPAMAAHLINNYIFLAIVRFMA